MWTWNTSSKITEPKEAQYRRYCCETIHDRYDDHWYVVDVAGPQGRGFAPVVGKSLMLLSLIIKHRKSTGLNSFIIYTDRRLVDLVLDHFYSYKGVSYSRETSRSVHIIRLDFSKCVED